MIRMFLYAVWMLRILTNEVEDLDDGEERTVIA